MTTDCTDLTSNNVIIYIIVYYLLIVEDMEMKAWILRDVHPNYYPKQEINCLYILLISTHVIQFIFHHRLHLTFHLLQEIILSADM